MAMKSETNEIKQRKQFIRQVVTAANIHMFTITRD